MTVSYIDQNRKGKNGRNRNYDSNNRGSCSTDLVHMSDYKWCHGPSCHKDKTPCLVYWDLDADGWRMATGNAKVRI